MPESALADKLLFLPGAAGNTRLWQPVSDGLDHPGEREFIAWPGFGDVPREPDVNGIDDLVRLVAASMTGPVDLLAQSMGGVIAIRAALEKPGLVRHMVLSVTSGGIDVSSLGGADWRPGYRQSHPAYPDWFLKERQDLSQRLAELDFPVLLLWGNADPISPVAVGQRLAELLPQTELVIVEGGTHDLVSDRCSEVLPRIRRHLLR